MKFKLAPSHILVALILLLSGLVVFDMGKVRSDQDESAADAPFHVVDTGGATSAPDFTLPTSMGGSVRLADATKSGPVVLDFWATWCGPCNMELPLINDVYEHYKSRGVQVYGIDSDATAAQIRYFFRNQHVGFPMLVDNGAVAQSYGVDSIPRVFVIDRNGLVRAQDDGYDPATQKDLSQCLDRLLKE